MLKRSRCTVRKKHSVSPPLPKFSNKTMIYLQNNGIPRAYPIKSIISNEILIYSNIVQNREEKTMFGACSRFVCARRKKNSQPNSLMENSFLTVKYFFKNLNYTFYLENKAIFSSVCLLHSYETFSFQARI